MLLKYPLQKSVQGLIARNQNREAISPSIDASVYDIADNSRPRAFAE